MSKQIKLMMNVCFSLILFICAMLPLDAADYKLSLIKRFYSIGTASINGTYYPVGNSIARNLTKKMKNIVFLAEPTAGSVANIQYLRNGQVDLALVQSDVAWQAFRGVGNFENNRFRELKVLASLYSEVIQIVVKKSSGIKTIRDLKGCKVSVGSKESGSAVNAIQVLSAAGLNEDDYHLVYERFTRATESLRDGYVDAVYYTGGIPADGISRLAAKADLMLVEVPEDVKNKLVKDFPYFSAEVIPAGTYKGQIEKVSTMGLRALLTGSEQLENQEVAQMLEIIYNNSSILTSQKISGMVFHLPDGMKGIEAEMLHSGAKEFFAKHVMKSASSPPTNP